MNNGFDSFLWTMIVALLFQNVVFARGIGIGRIIKVSEDDSLIFPYMIIIIIFTAVSSLFGWSISLLQLDAVWHAVLEPLIFVSAMVILYFLTRFGLQGKNASWMRKAYHVLSPAALNTTVLGTVLVAFRGSYSLAQYMGLSIGTGLGFAAAAYVIHSGMMRIDNMEIGSSFKGFPIKLIYIGIIAIGIYGFIGKSILL